MRALLFAFGGLCLFAFFDCSPAQLCTPGKTESCPCLGGGQVGVQICKVDGSGWGACVCPGGDGGNGGGDRVPADKATPTDNEMLHEQRVEAVITCTPGQVVGCYTGPVGTAKIGACMRGKQTCSPGATWGKCEGEVTPVDEETARCDGEDNNCNGVVDEGCRETLPKAVLKFPLNGAVLSNPTFYWEPVPGAVGYIVILQKSEIGDVIWRSFFVPTPKAETTYPSSANPLTSNLRYYWFVYAFSSAPKDSTVVGDSKSLVRMFKAQ